MAAQKTVRAFHERLCKTRVLDPACGTANFLYVTLEHMKRLEGEVLNALREFGDTQKIIFEVDPHQFLGIEVNPRAAAIADLVLWIGYLQWHFRTRGHSAPAEPIIKAYKNIECRDAVLAWDRKELVLDEELKPVTRWDGRTMKVSPVTGEEVPDDTARVNVEKFINPHKAEWPEAEFVVGNPPFIGFARMRDSLGDGYVTAIRSTYSQVPESCDLVTYWWFNAAELVASSNLQRFGLITTNSIRQTFTRRVTASFLESATPISLVFAIPDHPWVDSAEGAAVRIAMTAGAKGERAGLLCEVISEKATDEDEIAVELTQRRGKINADLTIGADVTALVELRSNSGIGNRGVQLIGEGFIVRDGEAASIGFDSDPAVRSVIHPYRNGRDIMDKPRAVKVIDLFGWNLDDVRSKIPSVFQWVLERVKPSRDHNARASYRDKWWIFGEPVKTTRKAIRGLNRYIVTCRTAKHRVFLFVDGDVIPDAKLITVAVDDAYYVGVLSSGIHVTWAMKTGAWLGVGNDSNYNHSECFAKFPFPIPSDALRTSIRELGEQLDAHRKRQQALHPALTLTDMYNVLEKLRSGEELTAKERTIHEQGLVSVLRQLHDDLDAAVFAAYGWPVTLTDEEILERLVALNAERAAEERSGLIRWLRPEFQNPTGDSQRQSSMGFQPVSDEDEADETSRRALAPGSKRGKSIKSAAATKTKKPAKRPWPKEREAQAKAVLAALRDCEAPVTPEELAKHFTRGHRVTIEELLQALATLGQARKVREKYVG